MVSSGMDLSGSEYVQIAGSCEHINETDLSAICDDFFFWLGEKLLASEKKASVSWSSFS
jgi:hypothetical protein